MAIVYATSIRPHLTTITKNEKCCKHVPGKNLSCQSTRASEKSVSARPKESRQSDISYFLRPKPTAASSRRNEDKVNQQSENGNEHSNTISADENYSEDKQISRSPTPKKRKKNKRGNTKCKT